MKRVRIKLDYTDNTGGGPYLEFTVEVRTIISATIVALLVGIFFTFRAII